MNNSDDASARSESDGGFRETPSPYALALPVARDFSADAPRGTWEDGYRLSLAALEIVRDRPEVFVQRDARMCAVEFKL